MGDAAAAGDLDGDGHDYLLIGAYGNNSSTGAAFVAHGSASVTSMRLDTDAPAAFRGSSSGDRMGYGVATGDWNGDGIDDVAVSGYGTGTVALDYGSTSRWSGSTATADLDTLSVLGVSSFGRSLTGVGDLNGDGHAELVVGALTLAGGSGYTGGAMVYMGSASGIAPATIAEEAGAAPRAPRAARATASRSSGRA